jgi:hypothetical protein
LKQDEQKFGLTISVIMHLTMALTWQADDIQPRDRSHGFLLVIQVRLEPVAIDDELCSIGELKRTMAFG